jgi:hypothetical protein
MSDYQVGYGRPPHHSRFKKGVCSNPKGRGARKTIKAAEIVNRVLNDPVAVREMGRVRKMPRWKASARRLFSLALRGDPAAAATLLKLRNSPQLQSNDIVIEISGGLPDEYLNDPVKPQSQS